MRESKPLLIIATIIIAILLFPNNPQLNSFILNCEGDNEELPECQNQQPSSTVGTTPTSYGGTSTPQTGGSPPFVGGTSTPQTSGSLNSLFKIECFGWFDPSDKKPCPQLPIPPLGAVDYPTSLNMGQDDGASCTMLKTMQETSTLSIPPLVQGVASLFGVSITHPEPVKTDIDAINQHEQLFTQVCTNQCKSGLCVSTDGNMGKCERLTEALDASINFDSEGNCCIFANLKYATEHGEGNILKQCFDADGQKIVFKEVANNPLLLNLLNNKVRPLRSGVSIDIPDSPTTYSSCTIGEIIGDSILTAKHCIEEDGKILKRVDQLAGTQIGESSLWGEKHDVALISITPGITHDSWKTFYGDDVSGFGTPEVGMRVFKIGERTGFTTGVITEVNQDGVFIQGDSDSNNRKFGQHGDSGSGVFTIDAPHRLVGILVMSDADYVKEGEIPEAIAENPDNFINDLNLGVK